MARLLLDSHVLLWALDQEEQIPAPVRAAIAFAENHLYVSVATLWELSIKHALGKVRFAGGRHPRDFLLPNIESLGAELLPIQPEHALAVADLPRPESHRDPFDRLLIAQALVEDLQLVSGDAHFRLYEPEGLQLLWE